MQSSTKPHCFDLDALVRGDDGLIAAQGFSQSINDLLVPSLFDQRGSCPDVLDMDHRQGPQLKPINNGFAVGRADGCERVSVRIHARSSPAGVIR
jgi:hypothetical protein